jgi:hypothetical protein
MSEPTKRAHAEMEQGLDVNPAPPLLRCADGTMPCPSELLEFSKTTFLSSCMECEDFNGTIDVSKYTKEEVMDFIRLYLRPERKQRKTSTNAYILRLCRAAWVGIYLNIPFSWRPLAKVFNNVGLMRGANDSPVIRALMDLFTHESAWRSFLAEMEPAAISKWLSNKNTMNALGARFFTSNVRDFLKIASINDFRLLFPYAVHFQEKVQRSPHIRFLSMFLPEEVQIPTIMPHQWLQPKVEAWLSRFIATDADPTVEDIQDFFNTDQWVIDPSLRDSFVQFVLEHTLQLKKEQQKDVERIQQLVKNVDADLRLLEERNTVLHEMKHFDLCVAPKKNSYILPYTFPHKGKEYEWREVIERHEAELQKAYILHRTMWSIKGHQLLKLISKEMTVLELLVQIRCNVYDLVPVFRYLKGQDCLGKYVDYEEHVENENLIVMKSAFHHREPDRYLHLE